MLLLHPQWHRGRVARQSSAKACTAVRIRSVPLFFNSNDLLKGVTFLFEEHIRLV